MCPVTEADGHDQTTADLEMPDESPSAGVGMICSQLNLLFAVVGSLALG